MPILVFHSRNRHQRQRTRKKPKIQKVDDAGVVDERELSADLRGMSRGWQGGRAESASCSDTLGKRNIEGIPGSGNRSGKKPRSSAKGASLNTHTGFADPRTVGGAVFDWSLGMGMGRVFPISVGRNDGLYLANRKKLRSCTCSMRVEAGLWVEEEVHDCCGRRGAGPFIFGYCAGRRLPRVQRR